MSEWILCEDSLPDKAGEYLVTYRPCYWDDVRDEVKTGIDSFRGKTTWAKKKYQRVIAWMPLPKPLSLEEKRLRLFDKIGVEIKNEVGEYKDLENILQECVQKWDEINMVK